MDGKKKDGKKGKGKKGKGKKGKGKKGGSEGKVDLDFFSLRELYERKKSEKRKKITTTQARAHARSIVKLRKLSKFALLNECNCFVEILDVILL